MTDVDIPVVIFQQGTIIYDLGLSDEQVEKFAAYKKEMENSDDYKKWLELKQEEIHTQLKEVRFRRDLAINASMKNRTFEK